MLFKETVAVYTKKNTQPVTALCGHNAELLIVEACGAYSYLRALTI
jgi:hypothetical protein